MSVTYNGQIKMPEVIYGIHSVFEALKAGRRNFKKIYVAKGRSQKRLTPVMELAEAGQIPIQYGETAIFERTSNHIHQGIAAGVGSYPLVDLSVILEQSTADIQPAFILVLDHIVDPQNLGSLIRTALTAGVHGIVLPKTRAASPSPTVSRVSAGAMEHALIACVPNISEVLKILRGKGIWISGMVTGSNTDIYSLDFNMDIAVVIGNEEKGIRPLVRKQCDFLASIPQTGHVDSLNASVAGAIALYEVVRQRAGVR
jgi:23S rRNA (guanosine2251-2'-O)-methyltransferase